jgi:hypothetical protein
LKKHFFALILTALLTLSLLVGVAPISVAIPPSGGVASFDPVNGFIVNQKAMFDNPDIRYEPGSRWWLAEGLNTDETIRKNVKILHDMGISQIEIVCMPEDVVDAGYQVDSLDTSRWPAGTTSRQIYSWGTEVWNHDTEIVIEECTKYGMGFSMTSGTHWANANLPDWYLMPDDDGAGKSLGYTVQVVAPGATFNGTLRRSAKSGFSVVRQDLERVVAIKLDPSSTATISAAGAISGTAIFADEAGIELTDLVTVGGIPVDRNAALDAAGSMRDSTGAKSFNLEWTAPDDGTYYVFSFWMQATGQSPTPSPSRNFTITYIDKTGMDTFINYYRDIVFADPALVDLIKRNGKGEMYMDSLEISATNGNTGNFWGYTFLNTFMNNRGYDLTPYLPYIIHSGGGRSASFNTRLAGSDGILEAKIRADLYETMTDCYRDYILKPLREYLNKEMNMKLRAELTYGVTYEITTPAQYVDYTETESLEYKTCLDSFRVQAGGAHIWGIRLSSETGALSGQNYVYGQDKFMQIINTQFASGIAFTVFHGYSAEEGADPAYNNNPNFWTPTYWPGHEGMYNRFSERWGPRQPAFVHYDDYMPMLARCQAILQQGIPQIDIGILHTDYNNNNSGATRASSEYPSDPARPSSVYDPTRANEGLYWRDMALQNNGYTYDYFAPANLDLLKSTGVNMYNNGELLPDRVGYQALIIYQDALPIDSAYTLLELAEQGLPIVIVDNVFEDRINNNTAIPANNRNTNSSGVVRAASRTLSLDGRDKELRAVMDEIKALPNVRYLPNGQEYNALNPVDRYDSATYRALLDLGVRPRAELTKGKDVYTQMRKTDDALYVFAYNSVSDFDYNGTPMAEAKNGTKSFGMSIDAVGKPYLIDPWTSDIVEIGDYKIENGRTSFSVNLEPGETAYFALDLNDVGSGIHAVETNADKIGLNNGKITVYAAKSGTYTTKLSDGTVLVNTLNAPANIPLTNWSLTVDSYTNGQKVINIEDRGLGYVTKEAWYPTIHKTLGPVSLTALKPWKDIPEIGPGVSGVGTYTSTFELPGDWNINTSGAYLDIESLNGNTAQVFVNGKKSVGFDFVARTHDISALLKPGANTITVTVSSTLENVVRWLGTQAGVNYGALYNTYTNRQAYADPAANASNPWQSYGMAGSVNIVTYAVEPLTGSVGIRTNEKTLIGSKVEYIFDATKMETVNLIELTFNVDGNQLSQATAIIEGLNGFTVFKGDNTNSIRWTNLGNNQYQGEVILGVLAGTKSGSMDIGKLGLDAAKFGEAKVSLTNIKVIGIDIIDGSPVSNIRSALIYPASATSVVGSKYDLNGDGKVDSFDLALAFYFYQSMKGDADWEIARIADVNGDGKVDLVDLVAIFANYTV